MYRSHAPFGRLIGGAIFAAVVLVVYLVLEVLDRATESKAMRSHVNEGSEKFFTERGTIWQAAVRATSDFLGRTGRRWF